MPARRWGKILKALCPVILFLLLCQTLLSGCGQSSWRRGGVPGSKAYTVRGKTYHPLKSAHGFVEEGVASWYGPGFHGRRTSSGELYNQFAMTAAHKILPLGTKVRVSLLNGKRQVVVRINDRGPFVDNRIIDLSRAAASELDMIGKGTARVRVQSLTGISQLNSDGDVTGTFYVQVGAFANRDNAERLVRSLDRSGHKARAFFGGNNLWNVQVGPWPDSNGAQKRLAGLRVLYPHAFVVGGD